jgi:hypothetical protein
MKKSAVNNLIAFPNKQSPVHTIRSRDQALTLLLPKFFGVL